MGKLKLLDSQKQQLIEAGYTVQDLGKDYGQEFNGTYRWWLNDEEWQDAEESFSEDDAWLSAWYYFTR